VSLKNFTDPSLTVDAYPAMRAGDQQLAVHGEHLFVITATKELGRDTGRRRYRVVCRTCAIVVHPATTGPRQNMEAHLREVAEFGVAQPYPGEELTDGQS
jgi:hypothetical protein